MSLESFRKILHPREGSEQLKVEEKPSSFSFFLTKISTKPEFPVSHLRGRFSSAEPGDCSDITYVFEGVVEEAKKVAWTFAFPDNVLLSEIASLLCTNMRMAFFLVENVIFLEPESVSLRRQLNAILDTRKYATRDIRTKISEISVVPGFSFFDGLRRLRFIVWRRSVVHSFRAKLFLNCVSRRRPLCSVCREASADIVTSEDPILPPSKKSVCETCFEELFADQSGALRFPEMKHRRIL
eukprot:jgi/Antlo1/2120/2234